MTIKNRHHDFPFDSPKQFVCFRSNFVGHSYDLDLEPDLEAFTFDGICKITFRIDITKLTVENSKEIVLHAKELLFQSAEYQVDGGDTCKAEDIITNVEDTTVKFLFGNPIAMGQKLVLTTLYKGFLNSKMSGFYRSSYSDIEGHSKVMASTQFEAIDARRALPCVDEPAAKAVFRVTMTIPSNLTCFSNMPEMRRESLSKSTTRIQFLDTPVMSIYLLAFCVGEFDFVQRQTEHGVLIRVYTPVGKSTSGYFALDCACRCLDAYDNFFKIPYPLLSLRG